MSRLATDEVLEAMRPALQAAMTKSFNDLVAHLASELSVEESKVAQIIADFTGGRKAKSSKKISYKVGEVVLMTDYSAKTHAMFGDTMKIKDTAISAINSKGKKLMGYNKNLEFGPGWIIMDKARLEEVETGLKKHKVAYSVISRKGFEGPENSEEAPKAKSSIESDDDTDADISPKKSRKSVHSDDEHSDSDDVMIALLEQKAKVHDKEAIPKKTKSKKSKDDSDEPEPKKSKGKVTAPKKGKQSKDDSDDEPEPKKSKGKVTAPKKGKQSKDDSDDESEPEPKKKSKKGKEEPKKKPKKEDRTTGIQAKINAWGNYEELDSGIIFQQLPVGAQGRKINVAIGIQDSNAEESEQGLESVLPLTNEIVEEYGEKYKMLNDEMMALLEKKDPGLHAKLVDLRAR